MTPFLEAAPMYARYVRSVDGRLRAHVARAVGPGATERYAGLAMELEISPEPTPEERAAIHAALAELLAARTRPPGAWWEAGVADAPEDDDDRPRTSPGL